MRARDEHGAASVEHVGLVLLIALLVIGGVAALVAAPPTDEARRLGSSLDRKIRCPARLPGPCWQDPLTEAYGRPVAGLVRALAPVPGPVAGPSRACRWFPSTSATAALRAAPCRATAQASPAPTGESPRSPPCSTAGGRAAASR